MKNIFKLFANIYRAGAVIGALCIFLSMILGVIVISTRFLLGYQIPGHYEITQLLLALIVYFSLAFTQFSKGNVSIELVVSKIKGRKRKIIDLLNLLFCLIVTTVLFLGTSQDAIKTLLAKDFQMGIFSFPLWPSKFGVAIGFFLLLTCFILQFVERFNELNDSDGDQENVPSISENPHLI